MLNAWCILKGEYMKVGPGISTLDGVCATDADMQGLLDTTLHSFPRPMFGRDGVPTNLLGLSVSRRPAPPQLLPERRRRRLSEVLAGPGTTTTREPEPEPERRDSKRRRVSTSAQEPDFEIVHSWCSPEPDVSV